MSVTTAVFQSGQNGTRCQYRYVEATLNAATDALCTVSDITQVELLSVISTGVGFTSSATPTIPDGHGLQVITLINRSPNTFWIQDQATLAGSNVKLTGASIAITSSDVVRFGFYYGDWYQLTPVSVIT